MKPTIYTRYIAVIAAIALLAACSAGSSKGDPKAELENLKKEQAETAKKIAKLEEEIAKANPDSAAVKAKEVSISELAPRPFDHYIQTQGMIEAEDDILVSAKSAGVVTQVFVKEGQQVSKGQTLAQIDNSVILRNIEAQKSQLELATSVYERQKNLWDQKIGTEVQYLQAKTNKESLEKQIASLQEQNDMTRIKSPIAGTVDEVVVKIGENIAPGQPAIRVVNTSDLKITSNISEAYITMIKNGNKVLASFPDLGKEIPLKVTFVGKTIDPMSRTFPIEIKLPTRTEFRPNMTSVIRVIYQSEAAATVIPVNVIQNIDDQKVVYVAEQKGKQTVARKKTVTVEGVFDGQASVKGLSKEDRIITVGYQGLNDGEVIKL